MSTISESVAVYTLQRYFTKKKNEDIKKLYLNEVHNQLKRLNVDGVQKKLMENETLQIANSFLKFLKIEKGMTKKLLCLYLIHFHGEFLFQGQVKDEREDLLREAADLLLQELEKYYKKQTEENNLRCYMKVYFNAFTVWSQKDKPILLSALIDEYLELEKVLESVTGHQETFDNWEPQVNGLKEKLRRRIERIGGKRALEELDKNIKEIKVIVEEKQKIGLEEKPNIQLAHDLFLDPNIHINDCSNSFLKDLHFEFKDMKKHLNAESSLELLRIIHSYLEEICPKKETEELKEIFNCEYLKSQLESNAFNWEELLEYLLQKMTMYCAPMRDEEIKELKETPKAGKILSMLLTLRLDLANFNTRTLKNMLNPKIMAEYESDWFRENIQSYERTRNWLSSSIEGFKEKGEKYANNKNLALWRYAFTELLLNDQQPIEAEVLILDKARIEDWRKELSKYIETSTSNLIKQMNSTTPVSRLLQKRAFETVLKAISFPNKSPYSLDKLGFAKEVITEFESTLKRLSVFFEFHSQVHSRTIEAIEIDLKQNQ